MKWLIYGAYGYTGQLVTHYAKRMGHSPILAGRHAAKLDAFAQQVDLSSRCFPLEHEALLQHLKDIDLVVHCAGPFEDTALPMALACLETGTHYLDITGEVDVFERLYQLREQATQAGIVLCPGVGFDIVPTDCIAARLKSQMPDATELQLGFDAKGGQTSYGTAKTSIYRLAKGGAVRLNGQLTQVPFAHATKEINYGNGTKPSMTIPWGDVATAYYTTGIPNIKVFVPTTPAFLKKLKWVNRFRWFFKFPWIQQKLIKKLDEQPRGPTKEERKQATVWVWGEVKNAQGDTLTIREHVINGYDLTAQAAIELTFYILHSQIKPGYYTPSRLYGAKLIDRFLAKK